jgi:hypothetical protein
MIEDILYRSPVRKPFFERERNAEHLIETFARSVTSNYNQDISFLLQGEKGSGKSYSSLRIAYNTARKIAEIRDGTWKEWENYFDIEKNLAVINPEKASNLMKNVRKFNVAVFDDIGVGWGSRRFMSKENQEKNQTFQVNRVNRTCQIMSMPHSFLIDKVPRMLCNYLGEMDGSYFQKGYAVMKVFRPKTVFRHSSGTKRMTPTLQAGDSKIVRYVVQKPPDFLARAYDRIREEETRALIEGKDNLETAIENEEENRKKMLDRQKETRGRTWPTRCSAYNTAIEEGASISKAIAAAGVSKPTWYNAIDRGFISQKGDHFFYQE